MPKPAERKMLTITQNQIFICFPKESPANWENQPRSKTVSTTCPVRWRCRARQSPQFVGKTHLRATDSQHSGCQNGRQVIASRERQPQLAEDPIQRRERQFGWCRYLDA